MDDHISFEELNSEFEDWIKDYFKFSNEYYELTQHYNGEISYELRKTLKEIFTTVYEYAYNRGIDEGYERGYEDGDFDAGRVGNYQ